MRRPRKNRALLAALPFSLRMDTDFLGSGYSGAFNTLMEIGVEHHNEKLWITLYPDARSRYGLRGTGRLILNSPQEQRECSFVLDDSLVDLDEIFLGGSRRLRGWASAMSRMLGNPSGAMLLRCAHRGAAFFLYEMSGARRRIIRDWREDATHPEPRGISITGPESPNHSPDGAGAAPGPRR